MYGDVDVMHRPRIGLQISQERLELADRYTNIGKPLSFTDRIAISPKYDHLQGSLGCSPDLVVCFSLSFKFFSKFIITRLNVFVLRNAVTNSKACPCLRRNKNELPVFECIQILDLPF